MASLILNRKYKLSTSDKFDEYMKALGELYPYTVSFLYGLKNKIA